MRRPRHSTGRPRRTAAKDSVLCAECFFLRIVEFVGNAASDRPRMNSQYRMPWVMEAATAPPDDTCLFAAMPLGASRATESFVSVSWRVMFASDADIDVEHY